jgi:MFS family permease
MTKDERFVILASSLGTVFEWYDFYLYGSLAGIIGAQFFSDYPPATRDIFALLAFAAGFLVRPFGAIVFGRVGDIVGRKYTFLVTILIMGLSTFIVGLLPNAATIGFAAPVILIALRLLQGLALGGEYGGAATYVAEHAPPGKRGAYTAWIQTEMPSSTTETRNGMRQPHLANSGSPSAVRVNRITSSDRNRPSVAVVWMNEV